MQQKITRRYNGEYSTAILPNGVIETCWFPDGGPSVVIGRTVPVSLSEAAAKHIEDWESER